MQALRITLDDGRFCDLSGGLDASQAQDALAAVRSLFAGPESKSEGWTIRETPDGFVAERGQRSARFTVVEVGDDRGAARVEMVGGRRDAGQELRPRSAPRDAAAVVDAAAEVLASAFE